MEAFRKIVITPPEVDSHHPEIITALLGNGIDTVHLRYPGADKVQMERVIKQVPEELHCRLRVHSHFELVDEYGLAGPHLNSRCPRYRGHSGTLTRSCHSTAELADCQGYEYSTLSPIFDSISKKGYVSQFSLDKIAGIIAGKNVIALGGVTPAMFPSLARAGFAGAAMLGYIWSNIDSQADIYIQIKKLCYNL